MEVGDREFLDLALSADGAVSWTCDVVRGKATWTAGMDRVLGMPGASADDLRARLLALVEPWRVAAKSAATWEDLALEQPVVTADGETRFLYLHARPLGGSRAGGLMGLVRDVTGLHRDRQALTDLADRYRLIVELSPDAICIHQDEVIRYANPAMTTIVGGESDADVIGCPLADFVAPASIPDMRERLATMTPPGTVTPRAEAQLQRVDGTTVPVELVAVHTTWEGRAAVQVIGRDVTTQKAAEAALRYQAALVEHVSNAIIATDHAGTVTSWNPAAETVYGVPAAHALGKHVAALVGAPVRPEALLAQGGDTETLHRRQDGAALVIRISAAEMNSGFVLVCADETARRRAEQDFATVVAALDEGVMVISSSGVVESANPAAERILGIPRSELVGHRRGTWAVFDEAGTELSPEDRPATRTRRTGEPENARVVNVRRPDGRHVWLATTSRALNPQDRPPHTVLTSFTDITERWEARQRLEYEATHDPLTALANRALVLRHLGEPRRGRRPTAVLFIDLDNFKIINDSLGHGVGDEVLRIVGQRLLGAAPAESLVGRLGGDEFVVVHDEIDRASLAALAERLLASFSGSLDVHGRNLHVNGSIGIVESRSGDSRDGQEILRDADVAMYRAKTAGGGRHVFFGVELRERVQRHMMLEQDLRQAVVKDQLWVAYQPIVDLRTEDTVGVEGLLRWTHPVHGTVSPGEFIPLAEESELINSIGAHMLRTATGQHAARRRHEDEVQLNVNLSPRQLDDPGLQSTVERSLAETGLPARALCFEVTENAIMHDPGHAAQVLGELRQLGVSLAIDDFGTGYSSLSQLRRLPLNVLKIDRSFVADLGDSEEVEVIVSSIIAMAHAVGHRVVAEGVETAGQFDILRGMGCDHAQGYYLGRPAPL